MCHVDVTEDMPRTSEVQDLLDSAFAVVCEFIN